MKVKTSKKTKLLAIMLILIMLISVGYAFLSTQLTINGTATVKNQSWSIYFTNIVPTEGSVTPTTAPTTSGTETTELTWAVSMDTPGQFYEFTVDAVNAGTIEAMIGNLSNSTLTTDQAKYLDYTVTYSDGAPIEQYDRLAPNGGIEKLKVRVEFKKDITAADLPATADQITLTYTSTYVQADTTNAKARSKYVSGAVIKVDGTAVGNEGVTVAKGETSTISIDNSDGMENITYASSDTTVATVDNSGVITGVKAGTATITLTGATSGQTKTIEVTVQAPGTIINVGGTNIDLNTLNQSTVGQYYGTTVATINGVDYGLYYVDYAGDFGEEGTVYLKALSRVGEIALNSVTENSTAIDIMKELNPQWATNRGNIAFSSYTAAEKGAMYLCNPEVSTWSGIKTAFENKYGAENVNYVIGGSSVELFMASYNAKVSPNPAYKATWFGTGEKDTYPGYLYSIDDGVNYSVSYSNAISTADGMYRGYWNYWLAAPLSYYQPYGVSFVANDGTLGNYYYAASSGVFPLVSLKSGVNLTE